MLTPEDTLIVRKLPLFAELSDDDLDCIASGEIVEHPAGTVLTKEGDPGIYFYLTVAGEIRIWRSYDRQDVLMAVGKPGGFLGEIPILLDVPWMATARVSQPARLFRLDKDGFWKMMSTCHGVAREILRTVAERFRNLEGFAHQREKLVSLGTMAAGLAHELNNPASAALRAASDLQRASDHMQELLCHLASELEAEYWKALVAAIEDAVERLKNAPVLDSLARSDKEESLNTWFDQHAFEEGWRISGVLVEAGLDVEWIEALQPKLPADMFSPALQWIAERLSFKLLLKQIQTSTSRVSELVKAVKSYAHIDNSSMQELDIHEGLESTLMMLGHKLKQVTLRRAYDRALPRIMAYGGELNQVWTNLIDNAIDAVDGAGKICVGTFLDGDHIVVEIVDDGVGIPPEIRSHIFEPFFTTKTVGSGTGLGLVISHRIVADRHGGEIEFDSKPGETRFSVRLPINRSPVLAEPAAGSR